MRHLRLFLCLLILHSALFSRSSFAQTSTNEAVTVSEIEKLYPHAQIVQVTPDELANLKNDPQALEELKNKAGTSSGTNGTAQEKPTTAVTPRGTGNYCLEQLNKSEVPGSRNAANYETPPTTGYFGGSSSHSSGNSGKEILIVLAIIGTIVVAALFIYAIGYVIRAAYCGVTTLENWKVDLTLSYLTDRSSHQDRNGSLFGLKFGPQFKLPSMILQLQAETGSIFLENNVLRSNSYEAIKTGYFIAGPKFFFPFFPNSVSGIGLELLAGSAFDKRIGLLSTLRLDLAFEILPRTQLALHAGAILLDLKTTSGLVRPSDDLNYLTGLNLGYQF